MDIVTLGAALNGSAEYVNSHFKGGSNIQIVDNPDGTQTINASGEVSSEDTVARAEIAAIKDGETLDSFGDVETALDDKADTLTTYTKTDVDTALSAKANSADVYSKTAVDTALSNKADKSTTYTKTEVDTSLSNKADKSTTYTKTEVDTALGGKVDKETGKGLSTNDYTTAEKTKLAGIAEGAEVNVQSDWNQTTTNADDYIKNKPTLGTAAVKNATDTYNATGNDVTTGKAVAAALATLPEPMVFKGSLGTGGTITTLPTASSSNKGYVYKVITAGTYASQSAKVGDTFISDGSAWVLIPSGDEPSGTVTNVAVANGGGLTVSGSPITTSGTITVGHSNSVIAKTSSSLKKFTYDANGHVTGSSELSTAEANALASGIDSTKVAQITTNENNISLVYDERGAEKNALRFDGFNLTAGNVNGVSYKLNADKSITVNGKPSGTSPSYTYLYWKNNPLYIDDLCNGEYVLSGCPEGGSDSSFKMYVAKGTYTKTDYGNGVELTSTSETGILFVIYIHNSYTANNLTFKPMICKKELWNISHKYEPNNTNKVCECYGDSLTWYDGNAFTWGARQGDICVGFESYLRDYLKLTVHNNGVMGETTPEICTRIKNATSSTILAADYITIMGGDNDDRLSVPVGTIAPSGSNFDTTTVIGALQDAIEATLATNARARIVIMTEPIGWTYKNGAMTRVSEDYPNAYRTIAEYYGLPLIDNWKLSGINEATRAAYMADPISGNTNYIYHPSNEGWRRISKTICDIMQTL